MTSTSNSSVSGAKPSGVSAIWIQQKIAGKDALAEWDEQIGELCQHVNNIVDLIVDAHKEWAEARIESGRIAATS